MRFCDSSYGALGGCSRGTHNNITSEVLGGGANGGKTLSPLLDLLNELRPISLHLMYE